MLKKSIAILTLLVLVMAVGVQTVAADWAGDDPSGNGVYPTWTDDLPSNDECGTLGYAYGFKIDAPSDGEYPLDETNGGELRGDVPTEYLDDSVTISGYDPTSEGKEFNWSSTFFIDAVVVKAGDGANVYEYDPAETSDTGLHAPLGGTEQDPGAVREISHITFCWDGEDPQPDPGTIIVEKQTIPDGSDEDFTFTGDANGQISDGEQIVVSDLDPGTYTSTEGEMPGWDLTSIECDDDNSSGDLGSRTATFELEAGETVKCTFTNTKEPDPGTITVVKEVVDEKCGELPGSDWEFSGTGSIGDFTFGPEGGSQTFEELDPGVYTISETPKDGFFIAISCTPEESVTVMGSDSVTVELGEGEGIECTFINSKKYGAVELASFTAKAGGSAVTLAWQTATELDNAGFNLYRATAADGPYTKVNAALIAADGEAVTGGSYSFLDQRLLPGTYYYKLEDVDYYGVTTMHGPVSATIMPRFRRPTYRPTLPDF